MSKHHFHQSTGPFDRLLFYYFISTRFQAEVLHLGSRNLNVEQPFSPVGRTPFTILLFLTSQFFASRTTNPACRLTFLHVGQTYPRSTGAQYSPFTIPKKKQCHDDSNKNPLGCHPVYSPTCILQMTAAETRLMSSLIAQQKGSCMPNFFGRRKRHGSYTTGPPHVPSISRTLCPSPIGPWYPQYSG